jgi:hypothetical protein
VTRNDANHQDRLDILSALSRVLAEPTRLVALLADAEDDHDAVRRLREAYDFTSVQAEAVLDGQFRLLTRPRRSAMESELADVGEALAVPWDPPLDVRAMFRSPRQVDVVLAGVEHRVEGEDLEDCLDQVVSLVRTNLARPERRRVAVSTGLTDGPTYVLVDPVNSASFLYDEGPQ